MRAVGIFVTLLLITLGLTQPSLGAVDQFEVKSQTKFYTAKIGPYIKMSGTFVGSIDPMEAIPNLTKVPRRADGRVEYRSEFVILKPEQASAGNRVLLFDMENRGHPVTNGLYNSPIDMTSARSNVGNGFLEDNGYTIVSAHWEEGQGIQLPTYTGEDGRPVPLRAVGFAAIRDLTEFLRFENQDKSGRPNPISGSVNWAIAAGQSQTSRVLKSMIYGGFNRVGSRAVFDGFQLHVGQSGTMPYIPPAGVSAKTIELTLTGDSSVYPFTYQEIFEPLLKRGQPTPKIIATNVEGDYYRRRLSLARTGASSIKDAPIPETVRLWDFTGGSHGIITAPSAQNCEMPRANLDWHPLTRAALVELTRWVTQNIPPPPTRLIALVQTEPEPYLLAPPSDYPNAKLLVPAQDADGIAEGGVRLPAIAVPLQTFGGWNAPLENNCGDMSVFAYPFARTRFERIMKNDPRPSLEERYAGPSDYVNKFAAAAAALKKEGYLLDADADALIEGARKTSMMIPERKESK